jgi:hypothetical protein
MTASGKASPDDVAAVIYADRTRDMPQCKPYAELPAGSPARAVYRSVARELLAKFDIRLKGGA